MHLDWPVGGYYRKSIAFQTDLGESCFEHHFRVPSSIGSWTDGVVVPLKPWLHFLVRFIVPILNYPPEILKFQGFHIDADSIALSANQNDAHLKPTNQRLSWKHQSEKTPNWLAIQAPKKSGILGFQKYFTWNPKILNFLGTWMISLLGFQENAFGFFNIEEFKRPKS